MFTGEINAFNSFNEFEMKDITGKKVDRKYLEKLYTFLDQVPEITEEQEIEMCLTQRKDF